MQQTTKQRERMKRMLSIVKKVEEATRPSKKTAFNHTELRLLKELMFADLENKRLISTQLADRLGVTRSSVSQMVNKLEAQGVVYREADEVDRKIAYVRMTDEAKKLCQKELVSWVEELEEIIATFGEEKMEKMLGLVEEFSSTAKSLKGKK